MHSPAPPLGDQTTYGTTNIWIVYVYQGMTFDTYKGFVNEGTAASPAFDRNFGGDQVGYATNGCNTYTETSVYAISSPRLSQTAIMIFTVGGDDGYRLSIDGGATWLINQCSDHSYQTTTANANMNGTYNLVIEYYERFGSNRVS